MRHSARRGGSGGNGATMLVSVMTLKRLMLLAVVVVAAGFLVSMHSLDNRAGIELERAQPRSFLRRGLDRFMKSTPVEPVSQREFFKQRAGKLSADQQQVVDMTKHAWEAYRDFANWRDFLNVYQQRGGSVYDHDMALTLVDSLDTLFIMGLHEEFDEASAWAKANLEATMLQGGRVSFFEVTIRSLGGLLGAYYLSGTCNGLPADGVALLLNELGLVLTAAVAVPIARIAEKHFLDLAVVLADRLTNAFTCGPSMPCQKVDLTVSAITTVLLCGVLT